VREVAQGTAEGTTATQSGSTHCGTYEENVSYVSNTEKALRIATFYRCLELRANTMAQLTVQYQRLNREGGNYVESNYGPHGVLNYLLQREPNPLMTAFDLWRQVEIETVARGNAFVYVERGDDGWPRAFWLAWLGGYDPATDRFTLAYNGRGGMRTVEANARDVLHFPNTFRMQGGYLGISTLQYARDMLSLSATLDKSALESAAKGGRMKLIIGEEKPASGPGTLSFGMFNKGDMEAYAQEIQSRLYGNDVVALRGLDKVQNISMSAADMQLFDQRQFGVAEICRMMAVPRTLAMDGSNSSYKTPEADRLDFLMNCIQPKRRLLEDELNRKLLTPSDFGNRRIHLCELPLMMFDKQGQAAIDKANLETGSMTVNEIRKQYDMPAVDKGDTVYVSTNLAELGSDKLRGTSQNSQSNPNAQNNQNTQNNPITQNPQNPQDKQDGLQ
jgi:HK97 family phage portal protein